MTGKAARRKLPRLKVGSWSGRVSIISGPGAGQSYIEANVIDESDHVVGWLTERENVLYAYLGTINVLYWKGSGFHSVGAAVQEMREAIWNREVAWRR